tara:strand:- start:8009 stop:8857 length:849 start_codon:yes stop_codon:yes gene_type:complete
MQLPNFLFIGPDKTGSTWIFEYLRQHPQCFIPDAKDIYFFDREYRRGLGWYADFFAPATADQIARGEISHDYILSDETADRIAADLPGVKILLSMRNPRARTVSHYLYLKRSGMTRQPLGEALESFPDLIENSRYSVLVPRYRARFPEDRLCCLFFDDLKTDPNGYARQITDFLGIAPRPAEDVGVVRPASRARSFALARTMKLGAAAARQMGLQNFVGRVKHGALGRSIYVPIDKSSEAMPSPGELARLDEIFAPEIDWAEREFGRDLSAWRPRAAVDAEA